MSVTRTYRPHEQDCSRERNLPRDFAWARRDCLSESGVNTRTSVFACSASLRRPPELIIGPAYGRTRWWAMTRWDVK
jgi:hypothetical protein